jgi:ubiquinone/menaquinone biosynthesis C-methylase UbiE
MPNDDVRLLTDRGDLQAVQYRTAGNLAARQSIYQFQRPRLDLAAAALDLAWLSGPETVADVGCGNGMYLAELARRRHSGRILGVDLSAGMLQAARARAAAAGTVPVALAAGDAAELPMASDVADVTLAMHMLYHVPDLLAAARELRRVTREGGRVLVILNGPDHLRELRDLVAAAAADVGLPEGATWAEMAADGLVLSLDTGAELLARVFGTVERHDFPAELVIPGPEPVFEYARSMRGTQALRDPDGLVAAMARRIPVGDDGMIRIRTHAGCLVCR